MVRQLKPAPSANDCIDSVVPPDELVNEFGPVDTVHRQLLGAVVPVLDLDAAPDAVGVDHRDPDGTSTMWSILAELPDQLVRCDRYMPTRALGIGAQGLFATRLVVSDR
jgi:hypothetical protein